MRLYSKCRTSAFCSVSGKGFRHFSESCTWPMVGPKHPVVRYDHIQRACGLSATFHIGSILHQLYQNGILHIHTASGQTPETIREFQKSFVVQLQNAAVHVVLQTDTVFRIEAL